MEKIHTIHSTDDSSFKKLFLRATVLRNTVKTSKSVREGVLNFLARLFESVATTPCFSSLRDEDGATRTSPCGRRDKPSSGSALTASAMMLGTQESSSVAEEGTSVAVAAAPATSMEHADATPAAAAANAEVTPSPPAHPTASSTDPARSSQGTRDDGYSSDLEDASHAAWYEKKLTAQNGHESPTVVDLSRLHDESDDDDSQQRQQKRTKTTHDNRRPLAKLSNTAREAALKAVENPADRALQRLLWNVGFRYELKAHQYEAVRAMAGVPSLFPLESQDDDEFITVARAMESHPIGADRKRGFLCADEMGLGKTVQSIGAMILRNKWHEAHRKRPLPCLVIGPNDAVLLQWEETLLKAGVNAARITYFKPRSATRLEGGIFVLMTRYNLQTEVRYLLDRVDMRSKEHPSSPLFPNAAKLLLHQLKNQYQYVVIPFISLRYCYRLFSWLLPFLFSPPVLRKEMHETNTDRTERVKLIALLGFSRHT